VKSPPSRSLNPKCHRLGHAAVAAMPHGICIRAPKTSSASECPDFTEKKVRKRNWSDRISGIARILEIERGAYRKVCFFMSSCLIFKSSSNAEFQVWLASHRFLNLLQRSLEASRRVIFLMRVPRPFSESNLRTGLGYPVWNTTSQIPLVIP
jgi:hypothetical protein